MTHIDRVTVTGPDDSINPADLFPLTERFPFVEWGILLSKSQEGSPRFPSLRWINELAVRRTPGLRLSGHLCGSWVRDLCDGRLTFVGDRPTIGMIFQRVQLNFHAQAHAVDPDGEFVRALKQWGREQYIFQFDQVNDALLRAATAGGVHAAPLFDTSGGAGIEPDSWPNPCAQYCGYAGGLHPDRIGDQLPRILSAAGDARIWIDIETHVRSNDDQLFDLAKVERFLTAVAPHVTSLMA